MTRLTPSTCRLLWPGALSALLLALASCGPASAPAPAPRTASAPSGPKSPADALSARELAQFLEIVARHPSRAVPEFTPADDEPPVDLQQSAARLVDCFRARFRALVDPRRQGESLARDAGWVQALAGSPLSTPEFASLVTRVSCAITRDRLQGTIDFDAVDQTARTRVQQLVEQINRLDALPARDMSSQTSFARTQAVLRLGQAVALEEFASMVRSVPAASTRLVQSQRAALDPLLPPGGFDAALAELRSWQAQAASPSPAPPR